VSCERLRKWLKASPQIEDKSPRITRINTNYGASYRWLVFPRMHTDNASQLNHKCLYLNHLRSRQVAGACQSAAVGSVAEPTTPLYNYSSPHHNCLYLNHLRSTHNSQLITHNCDEVASFVERNKSGCASGGDAD